jgi:hypothetical protein
MTLRVTFTQVLLLTYFTLERAFPEFILPIRSSFGLPIHSPGRDDVRVFEHRGVQPVVLRAVKGAKLKSTGHALELDSGLPVDQVDHTDRVVLCLSLRTNDNVLTVRQVESHPGL